MHDPTTKINFAKFNFFDLSNMKICSAKMYALKVKARANCEKF